MKIVYIIAFTLLLSGCGPVLFKTTRTPTGKTTEAAQLDNLECSNQSQMNGPWVYGLGTLIMRNMAANSYRNCMQQRGYAVEET